MHLEIKNISKTYSRGVKALDDLSLSIPTEMFGLLGPNGSGKSTLMRSIATLQPVDEGSIMFGSTNVLEDVDDVRRKKLGSYSGGMKQRFGIAQIVCRVAVCLWDYALTPSWNT